MIPGLDQHLARRKATRLGRADYSSPGGYYITICTHLKACIFGCVMNEQMHVNELGEIANDVWHQIPRHFPTAETDAWIVMPNHVHGIVRIKAAQQAPWEWSPTQNRSMRTKGSLGAIMAGYKSEVTRRIRRVRHFRNRPVWQRNYYDHIIRDEEDLGHARYYIQQNPAQWFKDPVNPNRLRTDSDGG